MESRYDMLNAKCFTWACFMRNAKCVMQFMNALCEMLYAKCVRRNALGLGLCMNSNFQDHGKVLPWKLHVSQCKLDGFLTSTDEGLRVYLPLLYPVLNKGGSGGGGSCTPPPNVFRTLGNMLPKGTQGGSPKDTPPKKELQI